MGARKLASLVLATPGRRALIGVAAAPIVGVLPIALVAIGLWDLAWATSWIFHFALVPSALLYAAGQSIQAGCSR